MLAEALVAVIDHLEDAAWFETTMMALGERHAGYGVRDAHYATVGGALLLTLEQGLGEAFTPEVREAWTTMYGIVSRTMMEAAALETAAAA